MYRHGLWKCAELAAPRLDLQLVRLDEHLRLYYHVSICCSLLIGSILIPRSMVASSKYPVFMKPAFGSTILPKHPEPIVTFAGEVPDKYQQQSTGFSGIFNGVDTMVCKLPHLA